LKPILWAGGISAADWNIEVVDSYPAPNDLTGVFASMKTP